MSWRTVFFTGCFLAALGLVLSLTPRSELEVAGALVTLAAIACAVVLIYIARVHRVAPIFPRSRPWYLPVVLILLAVVAANLLLLRSSWHPYTQALMMFVLAIQSLLNGASYSSTTAASRPG